ncbi:MAG: anthranilate synthase component I [Chloroflexi bacterium]|jgi:anthranilate synthase component I|nr:anthranilate synthase component I [Chloroflexota bacterium]MBT7081136.1 anthranilate synthase component I [Chloroflexota bacterium]MBT7289294.1 anthranilate synthase component I [Chloroflexota bacterium]
MYNPTLQEAKKLSTQGNLLPVYREIRADLETPVSAYLKVARGDHSFLLESVEGGERLGRYSVIGTDPSLVLTTGKDNPVDPLKAMEKEFAGLKLISIPELPRFHGGMVGYLTYEVARYYEELPSPDSDPQGVPESVMMLADTILIFDHIAHRIKVISHAKIDDNVESAYKVATDKIDEIVKRLSQPIAYEETLPEPTSTNGEVQSNMTKEQFENMVENGKEYIYAGDVIQVVLSQRLSKKTSAEPFAIYRALRSINPSPYMYFLNLGDFHIVGSSPELLVRLEDDVVSNHPIAGTRPRGKDDAEDLALEKELRADEKEQAEHIMLVDLARNDVGRVSQPATVEVTQLMDVERYSHVMHLVSHVQGKIESGMSAFDAFRASLPAGTVSGAPKIRAMEIIAELEPDKRGPYAGAVGYFSFSGNMDTAITIRTIVIKDGTAYIQAGGGIVADSVPELEYNESMNKAKALIRAIQQAEADHAATY